MNHNHLHNRPITRVAAIVLCAALAAVAGSAHGQTQTEVNRCVDAEGRVMLTDRSCPHNTRVVNDGVSDSGGAGLVVSTGAEAAHLADAAYAPAPIVTGLTRSRWADLPRPLVRKSAGTDATTLQAARTSMLMQDELRRQNRTIATR